MKLLSFPPARWVGQLGHREGRGRSSIWARRAPGLKHALWGHDVAGGGGLTARGLSY